MPSGDKAGSWAISKAKDTAVHVGARFLQKKTAGIEAQNQDENADSHPSSYSESVIQKTIPARYTEYQGIRGQGRTLVNLVLDTLHTLFGWERIKPKADYPYEMFSRSNKRFSPGSAVSDSLKKADSKKQAGPSCDCMTERYTSDSAGYS